MLHFFAYPTFCPSAPTFSQLNYAPFNRTSTNSSSYTSIALSFRLTIPPSLHFTVPWFSRCSNPASFCFSTALFFFLSIHLQLRLSVRRFFGSLSTTSHHLIFQLLLSLSSSHFFRLCVSLFFHFQSYSLSVFTHLRFLVHLSFHPIVLSSRHILWNPSHRTIHILQYKTKEILLISWMSYCTAPSSRGLLMISLWLLSMLDRLRALDPFASVNCIGLQFLFSKANDNCSTIVLQYRPQMSQLHRRILLVNLQYVCRHL